MAFNRRSALVWKNGDYPIDPASPVLISVDGQDQLVITGGNEMLGVDPLNGEVLLPERGCTFGTARR